jgi:hypothetical protein
MGLLDLQDGDWGVDGGPENLANVCINGVCFRQYRSFQVVVKQQGSPFDELSMGHAMACFIDEDDAVFFELDLETHPLRFPTWRPSEDAHHVGEDHTWVDWQSHTADSAQGGGCIAVLAGGHARASTLPSKEGTVFAR